MRDALEHLESHGPADWDSASTGDDTVRLTAAPALLRRASLVAIDEAGERISARCTSLLRSGGDPRAVLAETADLEALVELLSSVRESS